VNHGTIGAGTSGLSNTVSVRCRGNQTWVGPCTIHAADLGRGVDSGLAQLLLSILNEHPVKVHVVDVMQSGERCKDVRCEILQDVELITY
jgi:hypothetical protein